ncbi:carboxymuconolactone decarboxylase family protein [Paenibacillus sp. BK033]|uniref:carboxymuconolactone decarboxylase family protein n=1 Tax=Paenibacillus sp. BK033 TaxID=2512133 RepID=UPI0010444349|nr:carboxymuconolactone decarboxylase family protein [Paenibacillus sp. BK033]TCM96586.1 carboxymuconolactone decarboxylase family protein [Paenibacillus sp. BK033]
MEWFEDIYGREGLTMRERVIATIAMLSVLNLESELKIHFVAGTNAGLTREEMEEVIIQSVAYGGFPKAINAMKGLKGSREGAERVASVISGFAGRTLPFMGIYPKPRIVIYVIKVSLERRDVARHMYKNFTNMRSSP